MTGLVIVISGPGGVGKGTVVEELVTRDPSLALSRSWTTREPRPGEPPDAYTFVSTTEFLDGIVDGTFLEWNHFLGRAYYGSPIPDPGDRRDLVLEIDVNGARQVADRAKRLAEPRPLLVFIDAPSTDDQRRRLVGRGDSPEQVEQRMAAGEAERRMASELDYEWIVNDDVEAAVVRVLDLIAKRRTVEGTGADRC